MERPIIFSTPMIKAVDNDIKSRTRRVVKKIPCECGNWIPHEVCNTTEEGFQTVGHSGLWSCECCMAEPVKCLYGVPGDILFVKETWKVVSKVDHDCMMFIEYKAGGAKVVRFTEERYLKFRKFYKKPGWQSPYFMPKEACRYKLLNKGVRIERLQDIIEEDAKAEGVDFCTPSHRHAGWNDWWIAGNCHDCKHHDPMTGKRPTCYYRYGNEDETRFHWSCGCNSSFELRDDSIPEPYRFKFSFVWGEINAMNGYGHGWDKNDWVWVVSFVKLEGRIEVGKNEKIPIS